MDGFGSGLTGRVSLDGMFGPARLGRSGLDG